MAVCIRWRVRGVVFCVVAALSTDRFRRGHRWFWSEHESEGESDFFSVFLSALCVVEEATRGDVEGGERAE